MEPARSSHESKSNFIDDFRAVKNSFGFQKDQKIDHDNTIIVVVLILVSTGTGQTIGNIDSDCFFSPNPCLNKHGGTIGINKMLLLEG